MIEEKIVEEKIEPAIEAEEILRPSGNWRKYFQLE
jgi:hypothetical protein